MNYLLSIDHESHMYARIMIMILFSNLTLLYSNVDFHVGVKYGFTKYKK